MAAPQDDKLRVFINPGSGLKPGDMFDAGVVSGQEELEFDNEHIIDNADGTMTVTADVRVTPGNVSGIILLTTVLN